MRQLYARYNHSRRQLPSLWVRSILRPFYPSSHSVSYQDTHTSFKDLKHNLQLSHQVLDSLENHLYGETQLTLPLFLKLSSRTCEGYSEFLFPEGDARIRWSAHVFKSDSPHQLNQES